MSFIESPRFPDSVALEASGGPLHSVEVIEFSSGHEQRNTSWSESKSKYTISLTAMTDAERDAVLAYIRAAAKGRLNGFRYKDYLDYAATHADSVAGLGVLSAVAGAQDVWQLKKRYTAGSNTFDRTITKLVAGTLVVKNGAGVTLAAGSEYTIDITTGKITMGTSPTPTPATWAGEFDVPVRLDADYAALRALFSSAADWPSIGLVEIRI